MRVEGHTLVEGTEVPNFRHLHPSEVAILCGLSPQLDWGDDLRLALCAVGQLASPIQAGWIFGWAAHLLQVAVGADQVVEPADVLGRLLAVLRADAVDTWGSACGPDIAGSGGGPLGPVPAVLGSADSPVSSPIGSQARPCVCTVRHVGEQTDYQVAFFPKPYRFCICRSPRPAWPYPSCCVQGRGRSSGSCGPARGGCLHHHN